MIATAMRKGYLLVEAQPEQPGLVSVSAQESAPNLDRPGLRFAAQFDDIDAALMHLHECLRRHLDRLEPRRYAVDLEEAVAAADAVKLDHRRVFIEPALADGGRVNDRIEQLRQRHRRFDQLMQLVGLAALVLLSLLTLVPR